MTDCLNGAMSMSYSGLQMMMKAEGLRLDAYRCPANVLTIGYGHTGADVVEGMMINEAQAEALLKKDIEFAERGVREYAAVPLTQGQFNSLVDFAFNCGVGAMRGSTMLKRLNSHDYLGAADEFAKWDMAGGKHLPGLARRRSDEKAMFLSDTEQV